MTTLGIDLGGTNARAAVVDEGGGVRASVRTPLASREPSGVVAAVGRAAREAMAQAGVKPGACRACGVGVAAQLDGESGHVAVAPNLGWRDVDFGWMLEKELGFPVRVMNDLAAAAWGELQAGAGRGEKDLFVVFVGSGVGSAIISNGRLLSGATGVAGELGHIKVVPEGRLCGCGERGCLEAYAGGHNIVAQMRELLDSPEETRLRALSSAPGGLTPTALEQAASEGDPAARRLYGQVRDLLALALANQVTVLNPGRIILGGGVLSHCPGLRAAIVEGIDRYSAWVSRRSAQVVSAALGDDSGIIGAALLAREHL